MNAFLLLAQASKVPDHLSVGGWIFMLVSHLLVIGVTGFCFIRLLSKRQ